MWICPLKANYLCKLGQGVLVKCLTQWTLERKISGSSDWDEGDRNTTKLGGCMVWGKGHGVRSWGDLGRDSACVMLGNSSETVAS